MPRRGLVGPGGLVGGFAAFFPSTVGATPAPGFSRLRDIVAGPLGASNIEVRCEGDGHLLTYATPADAPRVVLDPDGRGWIVVKGLLFSTGSQPAPQLLELLETFLDGGRVRFNDYEGIFGLAVWDARRREGWALNDQASMLNLYYAERSEGLYVTTNALSLGRSLGLSLDAEGSQEFLARGVLLAPTTLVKGVRRLNVGEHLVSGNGRTSIRRHWTAFSPTAKVRTSRDAAERFEAIVADRLARYAAVASPIVSDLTGGLDSRLLVSVLHSRRLGKAATVNGPKTLEDVRIACRVAEKLGLDMRHFETPQFWSQLVDPDMRRELVYRTNGELPFTEVYHHLLSRPLLAREFGLHMIGSGGELLRYFPWSQEFHGIGRRRRANVANAIKYRFLSSGLPSSGLVGDSWLRGYRHRLHAAIEAVCAEETDSLTTQQLNAVYVWKMTSHSSLYLSATFDWLPTVAPLLTAEVVSVAVSMPWSLCLTSGLQRQVIYDMSPEAASVVTAYGSTAEPTRLANIHKAGWQAAKNAWHLVDKIERVVLRGVISRHAAPTLPSLKALVPFITPEFRQFMDPQTMVTRHLYSAAGLRELVAGDDDAWRSRASMVTRVATLESVSRELGSEPGPDFLRTD